MRSSNRRPRVIPWRFLHLGLGVTAAAGVLFACTFTQSLDYLQKGDGGATPIIDGDGPNVEAGGEAGGRPPVWRVTGQTNPGTLALDPTSVYWIADGKVLSVPKATGGAPKVLGAVPSNASALAADGDPSGFVFAAVGTSVLRLAKDGSTGDAGAAVFAPGAAATTAATIAVDDTSLFVLQYDSTGAGVDARILRMAKDGGGPADISGDGGATTMNLDPSSVFWLGADLGAPQFVQHAKAAPAGMDTAVFALGPNDDAPTLSSEIAVDATNLYWITTNAASTKQVILSRKRQPSASVVTIYLGTPEDTLQHIAIDDTYVYAIDAHAARLLRVTKAGGEHQDLLTGLQQPTSLAVDDSGIYVSNAVLGNNGEVIKIAK